MTTTQMAGSSRPGQPALLPGLYAVVVWQIIIGLGILFGASQVLQIERIFNLGNVIQIFLAFILMLATNGAT